MNTPTRNWSTLICLTISLIGDTSLSAQIQAEPISIVIHSTTKLHGHEPFEMLISTKEQKYIRASVRNQKKQLVQT